MADLPSLSAKFARIGVLAPQDIRDLLDFSTAMRTALVAIQELHVPYVIHDGSSICMRCGIKWPCATRRLADEGLGGGQDG